MKCKVTFRVNKVEFLYNSVYYYNNYNKLPQLSINFMEYKLLHDDSKVQSILFNYFKQYSSSKYMKHLYDIRINVEKKIYIRVTRFYSKNNSTTITIVIITPYRSIITNRDNHAIIIYIQ